jgi:hypothetical protein
MLNEFVALIERQAIMFARPIFNPIMPDILACPIKAKKVDGNCETLGDMYLKPVFHDSLNNSGHSF